MLTGRGAPAHADKQPLPVALSHLSPAGCTLTPIAAGARGLDDWRMVQLAIRCHLRVPVSADELEHWLEQQVHDLRTEAPQATVRAEDEPLLAGHRLADALRDSRTSPRRP
jgi:hypothetical protein